VREVRSRPSGKGCLIFRRWAAPASLAFALLFALVPLAANAHARFGDSTPASGAELRQPPALVTLRFKDHIEIALGSLRVLDAGGTNRAAGAPYHPAGRPDDVEVRTPGLERGQYTVLWQVVADDGHVGNGRFAFGIGVPAANLAPLSDAPAAPGAVTIVALLRFLLLGGLLIGVGLAIGAALVVPAPHAAPLSMLEFAAWLVLAFVAFVDIWVQGVITSGSFEAALNTRYGVLHLAITIAAVLGVIAVSARRRRGELLVTAAIAAVACEALSGHGATGAAPVVGVLFDAAHLLAAATWIGVLLTTLIAPEVVDVRRTSNVATYAVIALVLTAVVQVKLNVASLAALVSSAYGLEICAKIILLAIAGAIALRSRRRVNDGAVAVAMSVRLEVLVLSAVIAVTAVLVDSHPPR
jgi:copper transport protein